MSPVSSCTGPGDFAAGRTAIPTRVRDSIPTGLSHGPWAGRPKISGPRLRLPRFAYIGPRVFAIWTTGATPVFRNRIPDRGVGDYDSVQRRVRVGLVAITGCAPALGLGPGTIPSPANFAGYASMMSKAIASRVRVMPAAAAMPTIKQIVIIVSTMLNSPVHSARCLQTQPCGRPPWPAMNPLISCPC